MAILLGGYAAKRCPVRTHNDFAPLVPVPELEPSAELQADFDAAAIRDGLRVMFTAGETANPRG